jgi:hypothetical protein
MNDLTRDGAALARFRAAVFADAGLQDALNGIDDVDRFVAAALPLASARGFSIAADELRAALAGRPLPISGFSDAPLTSARPLQQWLPIQVVGGAGGPCVEWAYFGPDGPAEPFFQDTVTKVLRRPINRLAMHRTALSMLTDVAQPGSSVPLSGLIFHMSRCGSTLVSRMLAQDRRNIVISEAPPVDAIVRSDTDPARSEGLVAMLAALVRALGRKRAPWQERFFVKLDSWHILHLPLFRIAFPDVPWTFLFREPVEVLASQVIQRGIQTVPEYLPGSYFGLSEDEAESSDDYCALVLRQICRAALAHYPLGGGRLINYRDLPQAVWSEILPHFGVACGEEDRSRLAQAAQFDAKSPGLAYAGDNASKLAAMTEELKTTANRRLGDVYGQLEALRSQGK